MQMFDNGVLRDMTPEEEAAFHAASPIISERPRRVSSVQAVAFCLILGDMPAPEGSPEGVSDGYDAVNALISSLPKAVQIAWKEKSRIKRADLIAIQGLLPWSVEKIDEALAASASLPDAGAEWEVVPEEEIPSASSSFQSALAVAAFNDNELREKLEA